MIRIEDKSVCCGCTACASICAHKAITMKPDKMGFLYPEVDMTKCVDCGLCNQVCSFHSDYDKSQNMPTPDVYAARHKDMKEIETSRSGAIFIALSDWILEKGGVVYGVGYSDNFRVVHKRALTKQDRDEFKGSKYVQSDLNTTFLQVKNDLKQNRYVMFSGTPCQTSGLRSFLALLKIDMERLWVVDLVCHGVPGPYIWKDYLKYMEKKYKDTVVSVNFRDKSHLGWAAHKESFVLSSGKYVCRSTYTDLFYKHLMFRHSCERCYFTNFQRPSDITIADFWGWEKVDRSINSDNKGVSLLLINTEKGHSLFLNVKDRINFIKTDVDNCIQPNLLHPSRINPLRANFEKDYIRRGFNYCAKKYGDLGVKYKLFTFLKKVKHKIVS